MKGCCGVGMRRIVASNVGFSQHRRRYGGYRTSRELLGLQAAGGFSSVGLHYGARGRIAGLLRNRAVSFPNSRKSSTVRGAMITGVDAELRSQTPGLVVLIDVADINPSPQVRLPRRPKPVHVDGVLVRVRGQGAGLLGAKAIVVYDFKSIKS